MNIRTTETIAREVIQGLMDDVFGYINPANDGNLAAWMTGRSRMEDALRAMDDVCKAIANRPVPGQLALLAIAEETADDLCSPELEAAFDALEAEAVRVAEVREANRIEATHPEVFSMTDFAAKVCGMKRGA